MTIDGSKIYIFSGLDSLEDVNEKEDIPNMRTKLCVKILFPSWI